jgi:GNAT superfamily N-acetyltransferase
MATYFRQLGPEDTDEFTDHLVRWHRLDGRRLDSRLARHEVARALEDNQGWHIWLILHNEEITGYLAVTFRPGVAFEATRAYISALYVAAEHRGAGLDRQARRLVLDLGRWLKVRVYDFETEGESKHALALTRHAGILRVWMDASPWQATA